jgi:hypothetical protein
MKILSIVPLLIAAILVLPSKGKAFNEDSSNLAFWCTLSQNGVERIILNSYLDGTVDALQYSYETGGQKRKFCLPKTANRLMIENAYCSYIRQNPGLIKYWAPGTIELAMAATFPCRGN